MIDIEDEVYSQIAVQVRNAFPSVNITGIAEAAPSAFPCVSISEQDNSTYARTLTQSAEENHATVMYQIDVYSNKEFGRKRECRDIFAVIDTAVQALGFTRSSLSPTPNADASIYRMTGRYEAVVSQNHTIYRR